MSSHGDFLRGVSGGDEELVEQVVSDPTTSKLKDADKAILSFVKKLTLVPRKVSTDDILALARVGFSDAEIMDIIQIAAYFAFCNRISEGVGLTTEDFREEWLDRLIAMRSRTHPAMFEVQDKE